MAHVHTGRQMGNKICFLYVYRNGCCGSNKGSSAVQFVDRCPVARCKCLRQCLQHEELGCDCSRWPRYTECESGCKPGQRGSLTNKQLESDIVTCCDMNPVLGKQQLQVVLFRSDFADVPCLRSFPCLKGNSCSLPAVYTATASLCAEPSLNQLFLVSKVQYYG
jgi:hypothetical protein